MGVTVIQAGGQGPVGLQGSPGPIQLSVATPAALAAASMTGFLAGAQAYVQSIPRTFQWNPNSVLTPDNSTVIAASAGGNWEYIGLPGGVLGTALYGNSRYINFPITGDPVDWTTIPAGQTATIYQLPQPGLTFGEEVTFAASVSVQSAVQPINVTGATGLNVTPIVLNVSSTAGIVNGSLVNIIGVLGNTAANGRNVITVVNSTQVQLNGPPTGNATYGPAPTGNGAYSGGGVIQVLDFGRYAFAGEFRECNGDILNSQGGHTATDVSAPPQSFNAWPSVQNITMSMGLVNGTLAVQMTAPASTPVRVGVSGSIERRPQPGAGPGPVFTSQSVSSGVADGGTAVTIVGQYLLSTTQVGILVSGTLYPAVFSIQDDSTLLVTTGAGPAFGGVGNFVITTLNGTTTAPVSFTYLSTFMSISGGKANVGFYGDGTSLAHTGTVVTAWNDLSGNGQNLPAVGSPVYNATSTTITPNGPTVTLDGATNGFLKTAFNLAASGNNVPLFFFIVCKVSATIGGGANYLAFAQGITLATNDNLFTNSTQLIASMGSASVNWGAGIAGVLRAVTAFSDGTAAAGNLTWVDVSNGTEVTGTATAAGRQYNQKLSVGTNTTATGGWCPVEMVAFGVCNFQPSTQQLAAYESLAQRLWGTP